MTYTLPTVAPPIFPNSKFVRYEEFDFELVPDSASEFGDSLEALRESVLVIAARSRGWDGPGELARFREVFKLEPLYAANALVLIWREGTLVGIVGITYDLPVEDGVILHVGSLGLLPEAQNRGFLPTLFSLLWEVVRHNDGMRQSIDAGRGYLTAITQSPFIMSFLGTVSDLYPLPGRAAPAPDYVQVAERVVERFDPHIPLDRETFILRNEAAFFYKQIPYSTDARINEFCDSKLRYAEGDTFVTVGRVRAKAINQFVKIIEGTHGELFRLLRDGLDDLSALWPDRSGAAR
jgi:hypothetical protein